jgi:hypothetical protein
VERLTVFLAVLREMQMVADALPPFGLAKMTPATTIKVTATQTLMPSRNASSCGR